MEQLQEVFGLLVYARLHEMTQPTVKREAETGTAPRIRARTDGGPTTTGDSRKNPPTQQDYSWVIFVRPLLLLFSAAQKWKQTRGHRPLIKPAT